MKIKSMADLANNPTILWVIRKKFNILLRLPYDGEILFSHQPFFFF